jgi:hypothetical protein
MVGAGVNYAGLFASSIGTNRFIYMTDIGSGSPGGVGVRRWLITTNGSAAASDSGVTLVPVSNSLPMDVFPQDMALDASGRIFVIQKLAPSAPQTNRVLAFAAYSGSPLTTPLWTVTDPSLDTALGIAAALHTNLVAVVSRYSTTNAISVYDADTGATVTTPGLNTGPLSFGWPEYTDVCWDRSGNLYVADWLNSSWTAYSPPGTNQYQTLSVQTVKIGSYSRPTLQAPGWSTNQFHTTLIGELGVNYAIESSSNLLNWVAIATNRAYAQTNSWTWPAADSWSFIRARVAP